MSGRPTSKSLLHDTSTASRLKFWVLSFWFWTLLALSSAVSAALSEISQGNPPTWTRMVLWNLTNFWLWMLVTPCIAWLGSLTATGSWSRFWLLHLPGSSFLASVQTLTRLSAFWMLCGPRQPSVHTLGQYLRSELVYNLYLAVLTYWIVLAVARGLESSRRLQDERIRSAELETQLAQSQLQALRTQIQPHFLFNTLNAISALALAKPRQARQMIARLSDLLRFTLEEHPTQLLPLRRELDFVRNYLDIQRVRFRDRLETRFEISEDALRAEVPGMVLQPLVENALHHGLLAKRSRGQLRIVAQRGGGYLRLVVEDDGLGISPAGVVEGVGLGNIRARLARLFGASASLAIGPREGGGTRVELCLPFMPATVQGAR